MPDTRCSVIIVVNNSQPFLEKALRSLEKQSLKPHEVVLVDSGSEKTDYLYETAADLNLKVVLGGKNIGFCKANNIGMEHLDPDSHYVFFMNPDAFPFRDYIEKAANYLEDSRNKSCGAITGKTFGFDIDAGKATGLYDTTGIFRTWYGKWYDRAQGEAVSPLLFTTLEELPAICGAVFFCRRQALKDVLINGREVFNESFYMYKEDIDLSLRLRKKGWKLTFHPDLLAYHCRGWDSDRQKVSRLFRVCSAKNELKIHLQQRFVPGVVYSSLKLAAVKLLDY